MLVSFVIVHFKPLGWINIVKLQRVLPSISCQPESEAVHYPYLRQRCDNHLSSVVSCDIGFILISDHSPVHLQLSIPQQTFPNKYWKFNSSLLTNVEACNKIRLWLDQYRQDNAASPVAPAVIWDAAKAVIRGQLISYTSARKKNITKQTELLTKELVNLETLQSPTDENLKKLNDVRNSLNLTQTEHIKKLLGPHVLRLAWISYWNMAYARIQKLSYAQKKSDVSKCAYAWIQALFLCTSQSTWNWAHM